MNSVHARGGWRGPRIRWDPAAPVQASGYDAEMRARAEGELEARLAALRDLIEARNDELTGGDYPDSDSEEGFFDRPVFREEE